MDSVGTLLNQARSLGAAGHLQAASATYQLVLVKSPHSREARLFVAQHAARAGDLLTAVMHLESAVDSDQNDVEAHQMLGVALAQLVTDESARSIIDTVLRDRPNAFTAGLYRALIHERAGEDRAALVSYTRVIKMAQSNGFWFDRDTTQPWLLDLVKHAMAVAQSGRLKLFDQWSSQLRDRHGSSELRRVEQCLSMYLGREPTVYADPRQRPTFLYFPGLPATPFFAREELACSGEYEAQASGIAEELACIEVGAEPLLPFHAELSRAQREILTTGGEWDAYFFFKDGVRNDAHHAACPRTSHALSRLPLDHVPGHGPEVCFSLMRPGAHILPHRGVSNTRAVLHLGLSVPAGCALRLTDVGEVEWEPGRCFAFDDTYEHEAWNRSQQSRGILLGDIWNPWLTPVERAATADLIELIGNFNASPPEPPPLLPAA